MMKRRLFVLLTFMILSLSSFAQDSMAVVNPRAVRFAYLSYSQTLQSMPEYKLVQESLKKMRAQYEAEQKRAEQDFNIKYEAFLEGQRDFPETILRKRQTELKEIIERNIAFKAEVREQLSKAETEAMAPLKARLAAVLTRIGLERGYAFILNTDQNAVPFIHPGMGKDISGKVLEELKKDGTQELKDGRIEGWKN